MRARQAACALTLAVVLASAAASPAAGAIALRGASSAPQANRTTVVVPKPAGVVAGDVMVANLVHLGSGAITAPAGWTEVRTDGTATARMSSFVKVAGAAEGANYTFTSTRDDWTAGIVAYTGVDTATPVDMHATASGATGAAGAPSVTTTYPNAKRVAFAVLAGTTAHTWTSAAERFDQAGTTFRLSAADSDHAVPGATGVATATGVSGQWMAHSVALNEAPELTATLPSSNYTFTGLEPNGVNESTDQVTTVTSNRVWGLKIRDTGGNGGRMRQWTGSAYGAGLLSAPLQWRLRLIDGVLQSTSFADLTATSAPVVTGRPASATPVSVAVRYRQPIDYTDARLPAGQSYRTSIEYDAAHGF